MALVVACIGLVIGALGVAGVVRPRWLLDLVGSTWRSPAGMYLVAGLRIAIGLLLVLAAPSCRAPEIVRIVGIISVLAGVLVPALGRARISRLVDWFVARRPAVVRLWCLLVIAFGGFLVYAGT